MPKVKTRRAILRRFKITSTGKILRGHQYAGHRKSHKSKRLLRSYHRTVQLTKTQSRQIRGVIGG